MDPTIHIPTEYQHTVKFARKKTSGTVDERISQVADYVLNYHDPTGLMERYVHGLNKKEKIILTLQRFFLCDEKSTPRNKGNFNPFARSVAYEGIKEANKRLRKLYVNNDS